MRVAAREGMIIERRRRAVRAAPQGIYRVRTGMGADRGWYFADWSWRLRGMLDRLLGGAGLRRGGAIPMTFAWATRWISGGWKRLRPTAWSA